MSTLHTPWRRLLGIGAALSAVVTLLALAFLWPSATSKAHDLPIALAGPSAAVAQLDAALEQRAPGVFDVVATGDRADAVALVESRDVYGAIVVGGQPEVLTTTAGSAVVAQQLAALAPVLAQQLGVEDVPVTDLVPLSTGDPRGTILGLVTLPLVIGGMIGGIGISLLVVGVWRRVAATGAYAVVGGLAVAAVLQGMFGALQGAYLVNAAIVALALAGIAGVIVGVVSIVGRAGIAVGPVLFLLFANPIASAAAPWQMLPAPWGAIGQWLPPGAAAALLRDHSYFPAAGTAGLWLALVGWVVVGLLLATIGHFKDTGAATRAAIEEAEDARVGTFS
ncbi:hypothetical protein [Cellulomonas sp. PhB150]|uniref:hypothetical protein n=1 Tax=Cellulomonas sp. PhB150 TaxID=2485188 RepID=UPI000FB8A124|nr:hypothetical protein [Cellulomonas sp. PhB150]ROS27736.1 hypothetical protein EDF34_1524 [Cellulomonas sp. PhB150]